ncbi:hypothetical protein M422DRAFT_273050 [Sphaerobolus stellatus SS14]|uniref:Major facilitator superfamily (MFS) profile domain-containing protein n=1 Tax=Sphaerobolus stellatus (strain SS14) TaxID=990650 RepID=A0A0C9UA75_SPHS4|nr:hypothetical protein M422DRAFT_273050 [Sphaerobolus stellatus SS14]
MPLGNSESETTPLLRPATPPVAEPNRLGNGISRVNLIIVKDITCRNWYQQNYPPGSELPPDACKAPAVKQSFAVAITFLGTIEGIGILISMTTSGYFAARFGRKPVLMSYFALYITGVVALLSADASDGPFFYPFLIVWLILSALTSVLALELVCNMYVVDVVDPGERTASLSKLAGWGVVGAAPSWAIGGYISAFFDDNRLVFYLSIILMALALLYIVSFVPESFPRSQRDLLQRQREEELAHQNQFQRLLSSLFTPFKSLRLLKPMHNPATGRKGHRLVWCGIHALLTGIGELHALTIVIAWLTAEMDFQTSDTGLVMTSYALECAFVLLFIIPTVRRALTPLYTGSDSAQSETSSSEAQSTTPPSQKSSTKLDIHLAFASWVIGAIAMLCVGISKKKTGVHLSLGLWALSSARTPAFKSLAASSVEPILQGEALSAI